VVDGVLIITTEQGGGVMLTVVKNKGSKTKSKERLGEPVQKTKIQVAHRLITSIQECVLGQKEAYEVEKKTRVLKGNLLTGKKAISDFMKT